MERLVINTEKEAYSIGAISATMNVAELIEYLEQFDEETPVYLSFDRGYTFGRISEDQFSMEESEGEEE